MSFVKIFLLIGLMFPAIILSGQNPHEKDSLLKVIAQHPNDTIGFNSMLELSIIHEDENDSMAYVYAHKTLAMAMALQNNRNMADAYAQIGITCSNLGKLDSSVLYYNKAITLFKSLSRFHDVTIANMNLGISYRQSGNLYGAINCFYDAIKYSEKAKDDELSGKAKMLLANAYRQKKDLKLAEKFYYESLQIAEKRNDKVQIAYLYNNIGLLQSDFKLHNKALEFYFLSLRIRDSLNLRKAYASTLENIACEYADMNETQKSLNFHLKALGIYQELSDKKGVATTLINVAAIDTRQKKYAVAIDGLTKAMYLAEQISHKDMLKEIYLALSENYELSAKYHPALEFHKKYLSLKDSILSESESDQLIEMNTKYETEKKENQNKLLATQNELSQRTIKQQQTTTYFIIAALVLALVAAFFIFKNLKQQRLANKVISEQKKEVEFQKELVEEHQKEIIDSITYAKRIQNTLLAHHEFLDENLPNNFVLFKPKDIVSGDFYWATEQGSRFYLAVCDSTGHGVPGAFMSLLNIGFLSEAIKEKGIVEPNAVFNYVRKRLIESISKEEQQDGMDGILICIDETSDVVTYAAAHNAPMLVRENKLIELPKDKMPVGKGEIVHDFKLQSLKIEKGDMLYLYTDGYADQFGGERGKKYKYKALNELLLTISSDSLPDQLNILNKNFDDWKGNLGQVDDVCVIGIKI